MNDPIIRVLLGHNAWATRHLLESLRPLSDEQLHRKFDIGPGSVHDTLRHIIGAMLRWADRIGERELRPSIEDASAAPLTITQLLAELDRAEVDLDAAVSRAVETNQLERTIVFKMEDGTEFTFTKAAAIVHVATHGMHHRAQVMNMRRRLGLPSLGVDLDAVEWELVQNGALKLPI